MKRIITLSMAAAEDPTWETVQARIKWLMADKSKGYDDIVASRQRVYRQPGFAAAMKDIMALQDPQIRARNLLGAGEYGAITAPTLVVWTSDDPTADVAEGRRIASMIPGARFEVMPGCGHWPQYEDPKTFNALHLDFLLDR
jgi:2-hydroxy-6-oxonona-2,4-dienedioate hydrolase